MIFKLLYSPSSSRDHGTLGHFRSLLSRLTVKTDPKKPVDATNDFVMTTYKGHLIACACRVLGIQKLTDPFHIPDAIVKGNQKQQRAYLDVIAAEVVEQTTLIWDAFQTSEFQEGDDSQHKSTSDGVCEPTVSVRHGVQHEFEESGDGIYNYTRMLCHFCALVMNFLDVWAEGNGE